MSKLLAQIFIYFSLIFDKAKRFWVRLHPLHPQILRNWFHFAPEIPPSKY